MSFTLIRLRMKYVCNVVHMHGFIMVPFSRSVAASMATSFRLQNGENCCGVMESKMLNEIFKCRSCGNIPKYGTDFIEQPAKLSFCSGAAIGFFSFYRKQK